MASKAQQWNKKNIRDKLAIYIHSPDCFVALKIPILKTESGAIFLVRLGCVLSMGSKKYITDWNSRVSQSSFINLAHKTAAPQTVN